ncbi:unnamed protein product [Thelazia callipaeda]|uniref:Glycerol-3-phosphate dehydrogenase [NAD(+)] n=1 Tax=Thelazia callipaeda TaxID=103827 RepID=A0A0N5CWC6_THECL|nr:unnamed protein product [Thelazia callipaeda]
MEEEGRKKITVIGSGNWGSAISLIIGNNTNNYKDIFESQVRMWVHEELIDGRKLTEIINTKHENIKYLPGKKLPDNVIAIADLLAACHDADILVFVIPHQFVENVCKQLKGQLKKNVLAVSLIKGFLIERTDGTVKLITEKIQEILGISTAVLMGANLASEVANNQFCEATLGCKQFKNQWPMLKKLFESDTFRINLTEDANTVELCGVLKNVVACAAGFADGLGYGYNTKAAIIRLGFIEIILFVELFYRGSDIRTFFESCGIADLIATCNGGRNRKICEAFIKTNKTVRELEIELLNGQRVEGPPTAEAICVILKKRNMLMRFPLFAAVDEIFRQKLPPQLLATRLRECKGFLPNYWINTNIQ